MHDKNESLLNRERHIRELKIWFNEIKKMNFQKLMDMIILNLKF